MYVQLYVQKYKKWEYFPNFDLIVNCYDYIALID